MKILIIKLSSVGDIIHALPVAAAIKSKWPQCEITWAVEPKFAYFLSNHRYIDRVIVFDKKRERSISYLAEVVCELRKVKYEYCLDIQGLYRSGFIALFARAKHKLGWYNLREGSWIASKKIRGDFRKAHVVERYLDVVRALGVDIPEGEADFGIGFSQSEVTATLEVCAHNNLNIASTRYVVLAPGSIWESKRWPARYFAELAALLINDGVTPVLVGAPGEVTLGQIVQDEYEQKNPRCDTTIKPINLVGKTDLKQLAYLTKHAEIFIGNDSGPLHIAVAVGTPAVVMFGPTRADRTGPYGSGNIVLSTNCVQRECMQRICPKHEECMTDISPNKVFESVKNIRTAVVARRD